MTNTARGVVAKLLGDQTVSRVFSVVYQEI